MRFLEEGARVVIADYNAETGNAALVAADGAGDYVAGAALFLASNDSEFVTVETTLVDGGLTAAGPELSRKFPRVSSLNAKVSGVTNGSAGAPHEIRRLD